MTDKLSELIRQDFEKRSREPAFIIRQARFNAIARQGDTGTAYLQAELADAIVAQDHNPDPMRIQEIERNARNAWNKYQAMPVGINWKAVQEEVCNKLTEAGIKLHLKGNDRKGWNLQLHRYR